MVAVIDYGMGNLRSVFNAIDILGSDAVLVKDPEKLRLYDHVILPGVGSFKVCMENLQKIGFDQSIKEYVQTGNALMGICLGMQILATVGFEEGESLGLNIIPGVVEKFNPVNAKIKIPHVGWNDVNFNFLGSPLIKSMKKSETFYFTHSYIFKCDFSDFVFGETNYEKTFTSAVLRENVFATQFHPEKSQDVGLKLFKNFINWNP
jgi:glutamine amidotransferase